MKLRSIIGKHMEIGEFGCSNCKYYEPEHYSCRLPECIHGDKNLYSKSDKRVHRCKSCKWGTFNGTKYFCILPRCMPTLGDFNGVDKCE